MYSSLVISLFLFLSCVPTFRIESENDRDKVMMRACEQYVLNYRPLYSIKGNTFEVARFNLVPDSLNDYLINCTKSNNFKPLKYSAALIIRQHRDFLMHNDQEYMLSDALIQRNGFIVLIRHAMKIGSVEDDFADGNYFPFFSGEVCKWIEDNKNMIDDFKFVEKQKSKKIE